MSQRLHFEIKTFLNEEQKASLLLWGGFKNVTSISMSLPNVFTCPEIINFISDRSSGDINTIYESTVTVNLELCGEDIKDFENEIKLNGDSSFDLLIELDELIVFLTSLNLSEESSLEAFVY